MAAIKAAPHDLKIRMVSCGGRKGRPTPAWIRIRMKIKKTRRWEIGDGRWGELVMGNGWLVVGN